MLSPNVLFGAVVCAVSDLAAVTPGCAGSGWKEVFASLCFGGGTWKGLPSTLGSAERSRSVEC